MCPDGHGTLGFLRERMPFDRTPAPEAIRSPGDLPNEISSQRIDNKNPDSLAGL